MPNKDQLEFLLKLLSKNGKPLPKDASQEEISNFILESLNKSQTETLKTLMNDKNALDNFLKNPKVKKILDSLDF